MKPINDSRICSYTSSIYNLTADYQKSICVVSDLKNYTDARSNCRNNGMQLYNINDLPIALSKTEILSFSNKFLIGENGTTYFVKGRQHSNCANINSSSEGFNVGFGSCSLLAPSICQFLQLSRKGYMRVGSLIKTVKIGVG